MRTADNAVTTLKSNNNTFHSVKSRMCCYFYSLSKILLTYCMYIIVIKATFTVSDTIKAIINNNIKLINTTSLSDSNAI